MVKDKFVLSTIEDVKKVQGWFREGVGVYRWKNKDLSCMSKPDLVTRGDVTGAPHWSYAGHPEKAEVEDFEVRLRKGVALVPEWYPECEYCKGRGFRTVREIAVIRHECDVEITRASLMSDGRTEWIDEDSFKCWSCRGTGHNVTPPRFKLTRLPPYRGGGFEVSKVGITKCEKLCRELEKHYGVEKVEWDYEFIDNGMGEGRFFTEDVSPFEV